MQRVHVSCLLLFTYLLPCAQHEVGVRNLEILNNTTDAKGRSLEVVKLHCPPPLFRTYKEAGGVHVRCPCPCPSKAQGANSSN